MSANSNLDFSMPGWDQIPPDVRALIGALFIVLLLSVINVTAQYAVWAGLAICAVWLANAKA